MAKKRGSFLGKLFGAAAVAGAAKVIVDLEKKAKEEGKDILDVAKEKADSVVESVKSGEAFEKAQNFAEKTVNEINSGEFQENLKNKINETVESVKSGEFVEKAKDTVTNLREGVNDILDGKESTDNVIENTYEEVEEVLEDVIHKD